LGQGWIRQVLDGVQSGVVLFELADPADEATLRFVHANPIAIQLTRLPLEAVVGKPAAEAFPNVAPERLRVYAEVCRTRVARDLGRVVDASGRNQAYRVHAIPADEASVAVIFDPVAYSDGASRDPLSMFLSEVLEHVPTMVFMKGADELRFEYFNKAGEDLLGVSRSVLMGKNDHDFFPKAQADFFVAKDRGVLERGTVEDIPEEPIETPQGRRWLHTRKIPIHDALGRARHLLGVSVDITEQKLAADALQEQLRQAQKMEAVGRLAGGVAHDFNNLLSVIMGYTSLSMERTRGDDPLRGQLEEVLRAAERARDLTRQLLAFSRQQVLEPRIVNLNEVIGQLERMLERLIGEDVQFAAIKSPDLGRVRVDPSQIEQVLMNLVVNARDAMPTGGKLTVETANVELDETYAAEHPPVVAGPHVMLAVSDTGHGMDRTTQARIFEPFFTTKEVGRGTGLGLSTVFGVVRQSDGHIWVYSEPGKGAVFKVYFPRVSAEDQEEVQRPRPAPKSGTETILVLEDEEQVRRVVIAMLVRGGYKVLEAATAAQALAIARQSDQIIDLLLTDVVMPTMSGPEVVKRVRETRPRLKAICMSGYTDETVFRHGILESGVAFLQKPITPDSLRQKIRSVLDGED
jgi:two-component system, cell cycle sensor histidine kinase and response regulator CckA